MLGEGAYGTVTKNDNAAIKKFEKLPHIIQEYCALHYLKDCKYILHATNVNYTTYEIEMELYQMSLRQWLKNDYNLETLHKILHDVLCGMIELADLNLVHSDIKPGNILINKHPLKAVLGDLGFVSIPKYSKQQRTAQTYRDIVIKNDTHHDVFSFGVCFLELVYQVKPIRYKSYSDVIKVIDKHVSNNKHNALLKNIMQEDRDKRFNAREILNQLYHAKLDVTPIRTFNYKELKNLDELYNNFKGYCADLNINRGIRGYQALLYYISTHRVRIINPYIAAIIIILGSLFGNNTPHPGDIMRACNLSSKKYKDKVVKIINNFTNDITFLTIIFN
jgi:serine/threonine protein kinase